MPTPKEATWYIEVRPLNARLGQAPGFAPADPSQMGSAVAIAFETFDTDGRRFNPPKIRNYLLTCAHVVRNGQSGPLYEEIFCWPHRRGYTRTLIDSRKSGEFPGVCRATVSPHSPCGGVAGPIQSEAVNSLDWVLLDVIDEGFQEENNLIGTWAEVSLGNGYSITGYPGGAGKLRDQGIGHFWVNGAAVDCIHSMPFQVDSAPERGTFRVTGAGRTAQGMSGGGTFDDNGSLVGLHRASDLAAINCHEIEFKGIVEWLKTRHSMRPVAKQLAARVQPSSRQDPKQIEAAVIGNYPMIAVFDRAKLRANLLALTNTGSNYRMLWLEGELGTGKSHSWELILHVAKEFGIRVGYLEVIGGISLADAMSSLVTQLQLDYDDFEKFVLIDSTTNERLARKFTQWLASATNSGRQRYWIVFDCLSPTDWPSKELVDHLVMPLTRSISGNTIFPYVTLLHLGGDKPGSPALRPYLLEERTEATERIDIESFVAKYAASIGRSLSASEMNSVVDEITMGHAPPYQGDILKAISVQAVEVVKAVVIEAEAVEVEKDAVEKEALE